MGRGFVLLFHKFLKKSRIRKKNYPAIKKYDTLYIHRVIN
nr:MAG TPA: hypothetical protein [Caudoviricetes sp.]